MTFIDSFEDQLVEAARDRRDARLRVRVTRRLRVPRRRGAAVALAALLVGVPAAVAAVGKWDPFDDPGPPSRFAAPSRSDKALDPELTATLGVLRRPQTDADRGVATSKAARGFRSPGFKGVKLNAIRLVDGGRGIVLVPFERIPVPTGPDGRPLPGFDPATYTNAVCLFQQSSDGFAGIGCHTASKIKSGRAISTGSGSVTGLVPDGVARVVLVHGDERTEVAVADNFFAADAAPPTEVDWLGPDGSIVRRNDLTAPPPGP
jgi:hypothetical protein